MRAFAAAVMALLGASVAQAQAACPEAPDFSRFGDRAAIEYGRATGYAIDDRDRSASVDRARDVAALVFPRVTCADGGVACAAEAEAAFAAYLGTALSPDQMAENWAFLLPRAGQIPPADGSAPLSGWRFTRMRGGAVAFNAVAAPPYVAARRERAWQYLQRHRSGERLMAALSLFLASRPDLRPADGDC